MARKPIEIPIGVDAGAFEKGVSSGIIKPVEDAIRKLRDLGDTDGAEQLEQAMRDAAKQTEKLKDETRDTAEAIDRNFRGSYGRMKANAQDAADGSGRSMRKVADTAAEASGELKQNLGETFSSFRGDLEDLPQIAQDVFGGMAGSVGGLLPALGLAAGAAGIGLLINAFNTAGEESDEFKQRASELAEAYIAASGQAAPAIEDIADALREMATATEDGTTNLKDLRDAADKSGNSYEDLARAMAGSTDQLDEMIRVGEERYKQLQEEGAQYDENTAKQERSYAAILDQAEGQRQYNEYLKNAKAAADEAEQAERNWREAGGEDLQIKAQLIDTIADAYDGVRDAAVDAATNEEGVFDVNKWAEYVESTKVQVEEYKNNLEGLKLTPEQWSNLMDMPEGARMSVVASLAAGPEEAKGRIVAALTDAGSSAASGAQVSFEEGFNPKADVTVDVDTSEGTAKVDALTKPREMTVKVKLDTSELDRWRPPTREVPVVLVVDSSPLSRAIDRQNGRTVVVNVEGRRTGPAWQ